MNAEKDVIDREALAPKVHDMGWERGVMGTLHESVGSDNSERCRTTRSVQEVGIPSLPHPLPRTYGARDNLSPHFFPPRASTGHRS
jgi:hypothetical protein